MLICTAHYASLKNSQAYIDNLDTFADDTIKELENVKKEKPDTPIIIMGHSMGGLIAVMVALKRPDLISGACLSAPCLKVNSYYFRLNAFLVQISSSLKFIDNPVNMLTVICLLYFFRYMIVSHHL